MTALPHSSRKVEQDDGWIAHDGGPCPVRGSAWVRVRHRGRYKPIDSVGEYLARNFSGFPDWWKHEAGIFGHERDIIAYRIIRP